MDIKQVSEKRDELEQRITDLINEFENSTGMIVVSVNLDHSDAPRILWGATCNITLP